MKFLKLAICAATASLALGGAAYAQEVNFSANAGIASDYVFRGVSQTDEGPQIFGGADLSSGIFYAGVWASNVDFYDSTDAEIDLYAGIKPTIGPVNLDLGAIYYGYLNEPGAADYAFWEFKAAGSIPVGPATVGAAVFYSPEFFGGTGEGIYVEANAAFSPADKWTINGAVGNQSVDVGVDYTTWNVGVSYAFTDNFSADLRYHDSDLDCTDLCGSRVAIGIKAVLP